MPRWEPKVNKFICTGVQTTTPGDLKAPGKFRKLLNVRAIEVGTLEPRPGYSAWNTGNQPGGTNVHSVRKFVAPATGIRYLAMGRDANVGVFPSTGTFIQAAGSFSGDPINLMILLPKQGGQELCYAFDSLNQVKFDISGTNYLVGLAPPGKGAGAYTTDASNPPTVATGAAGVLDGIYRYAYRYRSTATGEVSEFSELSAQVVPASQQVDVSDITLSGDNHCDKIDLFRIGGALSVLTFVTELNNSGTPTHSDNASDEDLASNETAPTFQQHRPWVYPDGSGVSKGGQNIRFAWGPYEGYVFGVGATGNRGNLYWLNPNDHDSMDPANFIRVTDQGEPLICGGLFDSRPFVFSNSRLYAIYPNIGGVSTFITTPTRCARGPVAPWAVAWGPRIYFVASDGVFETDGGPERELSEDIHNLFLHDGTGNLTEFGTVDGIERPNLQVAHAAKSRLNYDNGRLYWTYFSEEANYKTLVYDFAAQGWFPDAYADTVINVVGITGQLNIGGSSVSADHDVALGTNNGELFKFEHGETDAGASFTFEAWTPLDDFGDPRTQKLIGDIIVDLDRSDIDLTITPTFDDDASSQAATTVDSGTRQRVIIDINDGHGTLVRNVGLKISGTIDSIDNARVGPKLYDWNPSAYDKPDETVRRAIEWHEVFPGPVQAYVWGVILWIDTEGQNVTFDVWADGADIGISFTANTDGEQELEFTWPTSPFKCSLVKLIPRSSNANPQRITKWEWLADKEPTAVPNFDSNWKAPLKECDVAYVTGVKLNVDTFGDNKTVVIQSELEGVITTESIANLHESTTINENGRRTITFSFITPLRAHQMRLYTTGSNEVQVYDICWIATPEPQHMANWDASFEDLGGPHLIKGVEIYVDTLNQIKSVQVSLDGSVHETLTVQHNGRRAIQYPLSLTGAGEFPRATIVQLIPTDTEKSFLYRIRWIADREPEELSNFNPVWTEDGYAGAKFFQGVRITGDTEGLPNSFIVEYDGGSSSGPYTISHAIRDTKRVAFNPPFIAHSVRLRSTDSDNAWIHGADWVWEPAPDAADHWETQETSHDVTGFHHLRDLWLPHISTANLTLSVFADGVETQYTVPHGSGAYRRTYVPMVANKGKYYAYKVVSSAECRVFMRDLAVRMKPWGSPGEYAIVRPFGGPSREVGARI
jgi:hypothetical protein